MIRRGSYVKSTDAHQSRHLKSRMADALRTAIQGTLNASATMAPCMASVMRTPV
jgi:hypothetical protein